MLKLLLVEVLSVSLSLSQVAGDGVSDSSSDFGDSQSDVAAPVAAEQNLSEEVVVPAQEVIAQKSLAPTEVGAPPVSGNYMTPPGHLAYRRGAMVGLAFGTTVAGILLAYPLIAKSNDLSSDSGRLSMLIGGTVMLAGALGFGPSMGQLVALGRGANYIMPIVRAAAILATPALTMYFMGLSTGNESLMPHDYYTSFKIAGLCAGALGAVWGIVEIALTPMHIRRYISRYEKQLGVSNLQVAPMALENGGGMVVGFRF